MRYLLFALLFSCPAMAQEWIDYTLLMQQNADRVVVSTDAEGRETRTLDMKDGIVVTCFGDNCVGKASNSKDAVGCVFQLYTEAAAFVEVCSVPLTPDQSTALDSIFRDIGAFVAVNAVPPRPKDYPATVLARRIARMSSEFAAAPTDICIAPFESDLWEWLDTLVIEPDHEALDKALATPRLPVTSPC